MTIGRIVFSPLLHAGVPLPPVTGMPWPRPVVQGRLVFDRAVVYECGHVIRFEATEPEAKAALTAFQPPKECIVCHTNAAEAT